MTVKTECFAGVQREAAKVAQTKKVSFLKNIPKQKAKQNKSTHTQSIMQMLQRR